MLQFLGVATPAMLAVSLPALRYLALPTDHGFVEQAAVYRERAGWLRLHVAGGVLALVMGVAQLIGMQRYAPAVWHRWMGWMYAAAVLAAAVSGLVLAPLAWGGPANSMGFALLAIAWLFTTAMAVRAARTRRFAEHRAWIARSFALCLAGVSLRVQLPILVAMGTEFDAAYAIVAWSCWVPNLLLVDAILRQS